MVCVPDLSTRGHEFESQNQINYFDRSAPVRRTVGFNAHPLFPKYTPKIHMQQVWFYNVATNLSTEGVLLQKGKGQKQEPKTTKTRDKNGSKKYLTEVFKLANIIKKRSVSDRWWS